jgi:4-hydroxy-L-threonine phosphate dehydrogenase PdxA
MRNDWIKIKNYYIHHSISLEDLAKKFKLSKTIVAKHSREEGWVKLKQEKLPEIDRKVAQQTVKTIVDRKVKANERHNELFDKGLEIAELLLNQYLSELREGKKKTKASAYNLDFIMKAIANAQKGQRQALNIDKEIAQDVEPEIRIINGINLDQI